MNDNSNSNPGSHGSENPIFTWICILDDLWTNSSFDRASSRREPTLSTRGYTRNYSSFIISKNALSYPFLIIQGDDNPTRESNLTRLDEEARTGNTQAQRCASFFEGARTSPRPFHRRRPSPACSGGRWINKLTVHAGFLGRGRRDDEGAAEGGENGRTTRWEFRAHKTAPRWHAGPILASAQFIHNRPFQRITLSVPWRISSPAGVNAREASRVIMRARSSVSGRRKECSRTVASAWIESVGSFFFLSRERVQQTEERESQGEGGGRELRELRRE